MSKYDDLVKKLREIFQIDKPDLDFGIYRIINQRAEQIDHYLKNTLREKVETEIGKRQNADTDSKRADLIAQIRDEFGKRVFDDANNLTDADALQSELGKQLTALDAGAATNAEHENAVFSHLLTFFARYYDKADFISQRRYKGDTYAIPYSGEEVMLHWANKDQYYIKSGENFSNYTFKLDDGRKVHLRLAAADTAKDNRKDNDKDRRFALVEAKTVTRIDDDGEAFEETIVPIEAVEITEAGESSTELVLRFEYIPVDKKTKQAALNTTAIKRILDDATVKAHWLALGQRKPTESNPQRTLLEKNLTDYTSKNSADYFIHKNLDGFLRNELDFYIKNEVMHLDDVQDAATFADIEKNLRMIQCFRAIGQELIRFLAQIENFQKKLWLKKKFVVETNYCITLDRVPEALYPEIAANEAQWEQWEQFGFKSMKQQSKTNTSETIELDLQPTAAWHTEDYLKEYHHLILDTKFYPLNFKARLLTSISNLDEQCDGLVLHSENFQALRVLQERYRAEIPCIYIDPPYNTGGDGFLYSDKYQHSSWLTMMNNGAVAAKSLMAKSSSLTMSLDEGECERARTLLKEIFGDKNFITSAIWQKKYAPANDAKWFSDDHDYLLVAAKNRDAWHPKGLERTEKQNKAYKNQDNDSRGLWRTDNYTSNKSRTERPNSWYAIKQPITGEDIWPSEDAVWRYSQAMHERNVRENRIWWGKEGSNRVPAYKRFLSEVGDLRPRTIWKHDEVGHNQDGVRENQNLFGLKCFASPKPTKLISRILRINNSNTVLDYFAGSGTTGHALINLNREDEGKRKYILVEMGDHFDNVLKPRLQKVVYSQNWKNGKATTHNTGISHCFKYIRLESYEDTLNNLQLKRNAAKELFTDELQDDYLLNYMLDVESQGSLLSVEDFKKPFDYTLKIAADSAGAFTTQKVDMVETFNYLIGLRVKHIDAQFERGYVTVEGTLPSEERCLVLWRDCEQVDYDALNTLCEKLQINPKDSEYDVVYINGDHNIPSVTQETEDEGGISRSLKLRQIEPEFLKLMFEVEDV